MAVVFLPARPALGQGTGYWHTSGNRILDASNKQVRIAGISWYGFETPSQTINGLQSQDYKSIVQTLKAHGFNTIRIPLSSQMIENPSTNLSVAFSNHAGSINTDLRGLNAMQVLDSIIRYAGESGLKVILDHHRSEGGSSAESNGLWYTAAYPESAWTADWAALADRYLGNATVVGFDLHNEPHAVGNGGACWDCGGANDWHLAAERAGNAVLGVNPDLLIFVEGTDVYNGDYYWWGGNLEGVQRSPVTLNVPGHLVYSAHDYGPLEAKQAWFTGNTNYASLSAVWNKHWAYISQQNIAPVWLGEFGSTNNQGDLQSETAGSEGQWFASMIEYLASDPNLSWSYWAANGEDRYGYLDGAYAGAASAVKAAMLSTIQAPLKTTSAGPAPPVHLTAKPVSSSTIKLAWTVVAGSGLTFAIFFGTSSGHTDTVLASNVVSNNYQASNLNAGTNYFFTVKAMSQGVASAPSNEASAATSGLNATVATPSAIAAVAASTTQINVTWTPISLNGATYTLYGGTSAGSMTNAVATGLGVSSYLVTGLQPGTTYYFQVKAVAQGVSSAASGMATATAKGQAAPPAPKSGCHVSYDASDDWKTGFTAKIAITNTGAAALKNWTLTWSYSGNQQITQSWSSGFTQKGQGVTLSNAAWNGSIAPNTTNSGIGLQATYAGKNNPPSAFYVNGVACK